ncbi:hypothetical protein RIR_jg1752.t1 [Rhizophagus irregularis DAOM 181602=DAOM 197198]|nr:hypothetical protein RIR_jg1752.t1 [Rhizophagus irregularis DAOM 181602=DAOM 197198]
MYIPELKIIFLFSTIYKYIRISYKVFFFKTCIEKKKEKQNKKLKRVNFFFKTRGYFFFGKGEFLTRKKYDDDHSYFPERTIR